MVYYLLAIIIAQLLPFGIICDDPIDWDAIYGTGPPETTTIGLQSSILEQLKKLNLSALHVKENEPIPLQLQFNLPAYSGRWYVIYMTDTPIGTDLTSTFVHNADETFSIINRAWLPAQSRFHIETGAVRIVGPAHLALEYQSVPDQIDYRVLYSDYRSLAVVYSESPTKKSGLVLAREATVIEDLIVRAFGILSSRTSLSPSDFIKIEHGVVADTEALPLPTHIPAWKLRSPIISSMSTTPRGPNGYKCSYKLPELNCMYIGRYIVFNSVEQLCVIQTQGCSQSAVERFSFKTFEECQETCIH